MPREVLLLTNSADVETSGAVESALLALGAEPISLHGDQISAGRQRLTLDLSRPEPHILLDDREIGGVSSVWFRRPYTFDIAVSDPVQREAAEEELRHVLDATFEMLSDRPWIDHPSALRRARLKPLQLSVARRAGFRPLPTLVTNDPEAAAKFCHDHRPVVFKPLESYYFDYGDRWRQTATTLVMDEHLAHIGLVANTPCLFQQYVEKRAEYRVTWVDGEYVAVRVTSDDYAQVVDYRRAECQKDLCLEEVSLTVPILDKLRRLMRDLELQYGAIDLVEAADGELLFFEVNPVGQWFSSDSARNDRVAELIARALLMKGGESR